MKTTVILKKLLVSAIMSVCIVFFIVAPFWACLQIPSPFWGYITLICIYLFYIIGIVLISDNGNDKASKPNETEYFI